MKAPKPEKSKTCDAHKVNTKASDFLCDHGQHSDAHRDPRTGTRWGHPEQPYGVRKAKKAGAGHAHTKHGVYYSDKPSSK